MKHLHRGIFRRAALAVMALDFPAAVRRRRGD